MRRRCVLLLCGLCATPAAAQDRDRARAAEERAIVALARDTAQRCPAVGELLRDMTAENLVVWDLSQHEDGAHVELGWFDAGNGIGSSRERTYVVVDRVSCSARRQYDVWYDGNLLSHVDETTVGDAPPPLGPHALTAGLARGDADALAHEGARLLFERANCRGGEAGAAPGRRVPWALSRAIHAPHPWRAGRAPNVPRLLWPDGAGARVSFAIELEPAFAHGGYKVLRGMLDSRWGLSAIAINHGARHRWVLVNQGCALGDIRWIGGSGAIAIGIARTIHPEIDAGDQPLVLDLARGTMHYLWLREGAPTDTPEWELEEGEPPPPPAWRVEGGALLVRQGPGVLEISIAELAARIARRRLVAPPSGNDSRDDN